MGTQQVVFDKGMTSIVKGFAIIFMMLLHCYGHENYDVLLNYDHALVNTFQSSFKVCVGMFVFLVGYGYAFSKTKDLNYSLQHIKKLLIPFWTILFVFTLPFCFDTVISKGIKIAVFNLFGIDSSYNYYSWFVYFFIYAMCVMPFVSRFINKRPILNAIIVMILASFLMVLVHEIPRGLAFIDIEFPDVVDNKPHMALFNCLMMTPIMVMGYLFAHQGYYERIKCSAFSKSTAIVVCPLVVLGCLVLRHYTFFEWNPFDLDIFYAPMVIGAIVVLFNNYKWLFFRKTMRKIGEVSVYMWFFHALFYTKAVRWFFQPAITIFNDVNLVVLWTIVFTFFVSWLIKSTVGVVIKKL